MGTEVMVYADQDLKNVLFLISQMIGINISFYDQEHKWFDIIKLPEEHNVFCNQIRNSPLGGSQCRMQIEEYLKKAETTGEVQKFQCQMGLHYVLTPFYHHQHYYGSYLTGQVLAPNEEMNPRILAGKAEELDLDETKLKMATRDILRLDLEKLQQGSELLDMITQHMINNKILKVKSKASVEEIRNYLTGSLAWEITIQETLTYVKENKYYLSRLFKQKLGSSFSEGLINLRINKAKTLLTQTALPIRDVAAKVGVRNQSYFSKCFRKRVNMTPAEYRKRNFKH